MGSLCPKKTTASEDDSIAEPNSKENIKNRIKDLINKFQKMFEYNVVSIKLIEDLGKHSR